MWAARADPQRSVASSPSPSSPTLPASCGKRPEDRPQIWGNWEIPSLRKHNGARWSGAEGQSAGCYRAGEQNGMVRSARQPSCSLSEGTFRSTDRIWDSICSLVSFGDTQNPPWCDPVIMLQVSVLLQGGRTRWSLEVPPSLNHPLILWMLTRQKLAYLTHSQFHRVLITKCFTIFGYLFIHCFLEASHTTQLSELLCCKFSANCRDPSVSQ